MTERWTHNGQPVGQPQKPWRLTRAQRVEMEARVATIRADVTPRGVDVARSLHGSVLVGGHAAASGARAAWHRGELSQRDARILRARVAIALRAALRADEDARCEEVHRMDVYGDWPTSAIDVMREWPPLRHDWPLPVGTFMVPLALWEVEERRRRETVRVLEALLVWGLS